MTIKPCGLYKNKKATPHDCPLIIYTYFKHQRRIFHFKLDVSHQNNLKLRNQTQHVLFITQVHQVHPTHLTLLFHMVLLFLKIQHLLTSVESHVFLCLLDQSHL